MNIQYVLIFLTATILIRFIPNQGFRNRAILVASVFVIFWLQPALPVRYLDYFLPLTTLFIVTGSWLITTPKELRWERNNLISAAIMIVVAVSIGATRYFSRTGIVTPSRPPEMSLILAPIVVYGVLLMVFRGRYARAKGLMVGVMGLLVVLLISLKLPLLTASISQGIRALIGQNPANASALDIRWLGFSYIAFRLIHAIDYQSQKHKVVSLEEFAIYVLFFPAISAGPIDQIQRFLNGLRSGAMNDHQAALYEGGKRFLIGLFKKFVVADMLGLIALNAENAEQVYSMGWMWVLLYTYSFQIFFDFSGYTDIAIGLGMLLGIKLPENFNHPYRRLNLKQFWDNWHMSLTQWFRAYFFNPVSRKLRRSHPEISMTTLAVITQLGTMLLIGLWHGITWNFVAWGVWHGLGLFAQNVWDQQIGKRVKKSLNPPLKKVYEVGGILVTFHFVALGWVWFALPRMDLSLQVLKVLLGLG